MLGHERSFNKFKEMKIMQNIFERNGINLKINSRKKTEIIFKYEKIKQHAIKQPIDQKTFSQN